MRKVSILLALICLALAMSGCRFIETSTFLPGGSQQPSPSASPSHDASAEMPSTSDMDGRTFYIALTGDKYIVQPGKLTLTKGQKIRFLALNGGWEILGGNAPIAIGANGYPKESEYEPWELFELGASQMGFRIYPVESLGGTMYRRASETPLEVIVTAK